MRLRIVKINPILGIGGKEAIAEAAELGMLHDEIEKGHSREGPISEFSMLIKERYENFPPHPKCLKCRQSIEEKKNCFQTIAPGLYYFRCFMRKRK